MLYEIFLRAIMSFCLKFVKKNEILKFSWLELKKTRFDSNPYELSLSFMNNALSFDSNPYELSLSFMSNALSSS